MARDFLELENGIFVDGNMSNFRLVHNDKDLTPICCRLGYIKGVLIAVKSDKVIVYKPEVETINGIPTLVKIADFCTYKPGAYLKISIGEKSYIVDANVQITSCSCVKLH